ncbi:type II secretion system F family protein [Pendulispora rubella]|uniref:Type II secretion system F family protein n=1 Tax=Pendulispora rubella TaxID=2741070 RepID=A0ABZ2L889_9BACT
MKETFLRWFAAIGRGDVPSTVYEIVGLAFVWFGVAAFVYVSATDPRGAARRVGANYAGGLNVHLRSMFLPERGAYFAWLQLIGAIALLAIYGFVKLEALLYATVAAIVVPPVLLRSMAKRRRKRLDDQVHGFTLALANALKTTASIGEALWITLDVTAKPLREELETALKQVRIGSTLEEALLAMTARAQSTSLDVVVSALLIGRQTGGDLPRILEGTAGSLRELKRLEELTEKVTLGARQSLLIAAAITACLAFFLPRVVPGFFDPLRDTVKGQLVVAQCVFMYFSALYLGYRFTRMDI